jgi:hypothetical protein
MAALLVHQHLSMLLLLGCVSGAGGVGGVGVVLFFIVAVARQSLL